MESAEAFAERWLRSVAGNGDADRGWSQLDQQTRRSSFGGDQAAYIAAAAEQDWSDFRWKVIDAHPIESWLWRVGFKVEGGLSATPAFLRDRRLVGASCVGVDAPGISLSVHDPGLFGERTVGPGALTGTAERALRSGSCDSQPPPPPEFEAGGAPTWTGHPFEVRNNTTTPIFLLGGDGSRLHVGPCSSVGADRLQRELEVRATGGYIATIGLGELAEPTTVTTFIVIGKDLFVDRAPPLEPLPRCTRPAKVQPGQ